MSISKGKTRIGKKTFISCVEPYLYLFPAFFFLILFVYYPFIKNLILSLFRVNQFRVLRSFTGLENYLRVLKDPSFLQAVMNTFIYVLITVPVSIAIAFLLASLCRKRRRFSVVYEVLFALALATSDSVMAMIFQIIYNPSFGSLNRILGVHIDWLGDPRFALLSLMIIQIWHNIGYNFLFMLAAQRGISQSVLESAKLDGVPPIKMQAKIILPIISPMLFFLLIKDIAYGMTVANYTLILTGGGPNGKTETIITYIYNKAIASTNYNYAFAAAILGFIISGLFIAMSMSFEKKVHYQ